MTSSPRPTPPSGQTPKKPKSARRRARELALQGLYQWLINREDAGVVDANIREQQEFNKSDRAHFDALLHGCIREAQSLDSLIEPHLDRKMAELSPVEHAALYIGVYELQQCIDIPYRVVINEAVELTKQFGGTDGHKYVNGILDKVAAVARQTEVQANQHQKRPTTSASPQAPLNDA